MDYSSTTQEESTRKEFAKGRSSEFVRIEILLTRGVDAMKLDEVTGFKRD